VGDEKDERIGVLCDVEMRIWRL